MTDKMEIVAGTTLAPWEIEIASPDIPAMKAEALKQVRFADSQVVSAMNAAWHAGELLLNLKARLEHGEFGAWLLDSGINERTARRYMQLRKGYSDNGQLDRFDGIIDAINALPKTRQLVRQPTKVTHIGSAGIRIEAQPSKIVEIGNARIQHESKPEPEPVSTPRVPELDQCDDSWDDSLIEFVQVDNFEEFRSCLSEYSTEYVLEVTWRLARQIFGIWEVVCEENDTYEGEVNELKGKLADQERNQH